MIVKQLFSKFSSNEEFLQYGNLQNHDINFFFFFYFRMHEPPGGGNLIRETHQKIAYYGKRRSLIILKALLVVSTLREGDLSMISSPSSCLTHWGLKLILQQIWEAFCKKLRPHSHILGVVIFCNKFRKPSAKLKVSPYGMNPLQQYYPL